MIYRDLIWAKERKYLTFYIKKVLLSLLSFSSSYLKNPKLAREFVMEKMFSIALHFARQARVTKSRGLDLET